MPSAGRSARREQTSKSRFQVSQEVLDGGALTKELVSGLLDGSLGHFVVEVQAQHWCVVTRGGSAGEGEHQAFGDVVESTVGLEAN